MTGNKKVIECLNQILTNELTAINQYFLHSRMCSNWVFKKLAKKNWDESIDEMKHAHVLTDRILFLEGLPNLQKIGAISIGENVEEQLKVDLAFENKAIPTLKLQLKRVLKQRTMLRVIFLKKSLFLKKNMLIGLKHSFPSIRSLGREAYLAEQIAE